MNLKPSRISSRQFGRSRGFLQFDLIIGLAILTIAVLPLGFSFARERQALKIEYSRSVINELVDGEMEIFLAGAAKTLPEGSQTIPVQSQALIGLPAGHFQLTKSGSHLQFSWLPDTKCGFSAITREATLK